MNTESTGPKITLGLPVFNGENFLCQAITSVLSQTYSNFELIIRDNASSDRTEEICRAAAQHDPRVRYIRNPINIGAGPNFNGLVALADGEYFKWMAHDDMLAPEFLAACVEALQSDKDAVLACPRVRFMDVNGSLQEEYVSPFRTNVPQRLTRFSDMLKGGHRCFEIFGLIRLAALKRTPLIGNYNNGDGVLLAHLALIGHFAAIPDALFLSRRHPESSMYVFGVTDPNAEADLEGYANWFDPRNKIGFSKSFTRASVDYFKMVRGTPMSRVERWACCRVVGRWIVAHWRGIAGEWKRSVARAAKFPVRIHAR